MSTTGEATVNPDGSTEYADAGDGGADYDNTTDSGIPNMDEEAAEEMIIKGTDPALYLAIAVIAFAIIFVFIQMRKKRKSDEIDSFFSNLDGDKFNLQLPAEVDEYYDVKEKCEKDGWEPGQSTGKQPTPQHRALAQALMKRCIADIPIVTHIQRESPGMNKLYSQSMCSVKQWKSYQAAEAMVSAEVEEVRAEADEIEPGWSQVIWRQAMQYNQMLKQKEEQAKKAQAEQQRALAAQRAAVDEKANAEKAKRDAIKANVDAEKARLAHVEQAEKDRIDNAEKAAEELLKAEEREKQSKNSFGGKGGMKKGFLG